MRCSIVVVLSLCCLPPIDTPVRSEPDAASLARRFLNHMESIAPVAGTFTVETKYDAELLEASRRQRREYWASQKGKDVKLNFGPDAPVLHCEWAWDGLRESLETLDGSNKFANFYVTPEATLEGMRPKNYNLSGPERLIAWHPAEFYIRVGGRPWSDTFAGCDFETAAAPAGSPQGSVLLIARSSTKVIRLVINETHGTLHGYDYVIEGKPYSKFTVGRLERGPDGRVFPAQARLTLYNYPNIQPYQFMTLTADQITFDEIEVQDAMELILPEGTHIYDRTLNEKIVLYRPASAKDVVLGKFSGDSLSEVAPSAPLPSPRPVRRWSRWVVGINVAVLVAIGLWFFLKGARLWDQRRQARRRS